MKKITAYLDEMLSLFTKITTGVIVVSALYISIFWGSDCTIGVEILWQILAVSALTTAGRLWMSFGETKISAKGILLREVLFYLWINVVVLGCGFLFEWFYFSQYKMVLGMELCIAAVYAAVYAVSYLAQRTTAQTINKRLQEREREARKSE